MRALITSSVMLACAACVPTHSLQLPAPPEDTLFAVLIFGDSNPEAAVIDLRTTPLEYAATVHDQMKIAALYYQSSLLERWDIAPGLYRSEETGPRTKFPPPDRAYKATLEDGSATFSEVEAEAAEPYNEMYLKDISTEECTQRGGCFGSYPRCDLNCRVEISVASPQRPNLRNITACPRGWSLETNLGLTTCAPNFASCPMDQVFVPGAGCSAIPLPCTEGQLWPAEIPDGAYLVASPDVSATPNTIDEALLGATGPIVLSTGRHRAPASIARAVELIGTCTETVIEGALVFRGGKPARVAHLTIRSDGADAITTSEGAAVTIDDVAVEATNARAIAAASSHLVIDGLRAQAMIGVELDAGSTAAIHLAHLTVDREALIAVSSSASIDQLAVAAAGAEAAGIYADDQSTASVSEFTVRGPIRYAVNVTRTSSVGIAHLFGENLTQGIVATLGATLEVHDASLFADEDVVFADAGGRIFLRDVFAGSSGRLPPTPEGSVQLSNGSLFDAQRLALTGSARSGISATTESKMEIEDAIFDHLGTYGILGYQSAARLERLEITNTASVAIIFDTAEFQAFDLSISDTGHGLRFDAPRTAAVAMIHALHVERARDSAVQLIGTSIIRLFDFELANSGIGVSMRQGIIGGLRFHIHDNTFGMKTEAGMLMMSDGLFERNETAAFLTNPTEDVRDAFVRVRFRDNQHGVLSD